MSEYLWDRKGRPDSEIEDLERRLRPLRFRNSLGSLTLEQRRRRRAPYGAIAASLAVGALAMRLLSVPPPVMTEWAVTGVEGDVRVGRTSAAVAAKLQMGQPLVTGPAARVSLENDDFGEVNLAPESVLRVVESKDGRDVMSLERGRLHAFIWAPPRQFVVDTPSSRTVDLGCEYTLTVDGRGNGFVEVELGWVAFQFGAQESFIPAGAACRTTRRSGPGIPFYRDAERKLIDALERYESDRDPAALAAVLVSARPQDGLTLWHLLTRVGPQDRASVFDRFAQLVALPNMVHREKALAKDPDTLDLCWNALGLDDAGWWREWKHEWKTGSGS
jgi:hypothetical protein